MQKKFILPRSGGDLRRWYCKSTKFGGLYKKNLYYHSKSSKSARFYSGQIYLIYRIIILYWELPLTRGSWLYILSLYWELPLTRGCWFYIGSCPLMRGCWLYIGSYPSRGDADSILGAAPHEGMLTILGSHPCQLQHHPEQHCNMMIITWISLLNIWMDQWNNLMSYGILLHELTNICSCFPRCFQYNRLSDYMTQNSKYGAWGWSYCHVVSTTLQGLAHFLVLCDVIITSE